MPFYTGKIIDYASIEPDSHQFQQTTLKLVGVAFGCAVFTGARGGLFTLGMARLNMRIRTQLFHSLLRQDIGFFDTTKTGDITSRWVLVCPVEFGESHALSVCIILIQTSCKIPE